MRWLWHELTRPRGRSKHRFYRGSRRSRGGVALLIVLSAIMLLTILVTEIAHGATVRVQMAAQHRDEAKAEMLAHSGLNMYRLILIWSKQLGKSPMIQNIGDMIGANGNTLWQVVPFINTTLLRVVFVTGGDDLDDDEADKIKTEGLSDEQREESEEAESSTKRHLLEFDGDFEASVEDEERRINVANLKANTYAELLQLPQAQELQGLMSGGRNDLFFREENLDKWELIGALADWTDVDDDKIYRGGLEESDYERLDDPYKPKNAPFDTLEEIRLVNGWHRDVIWENYGKNLTIYGSNKINVNTADRDVLVSLIRGFAVNQAQVTYEEPLYRFVDELIALRRLPRLLGGIYFNNPDQFISIVESGALGTNNHQGIALDPKIKDAIGVDSGVFRVTSTGEVRNAKVTIEAVYDFSKSKTGKVVYWRVK